VEWDSGRQAYQPAEPSCGSGGTQPLRHMPCWGEWHTDWPMLGVPHPWLTGDSQPNHGLQATPYSLVSLLVSVLAVTEEHPGHP
jgi:hypothetical protein